MLRSGFWVSISLQGMLVVGAGAALGQDYPNRPIRIITSPAGGGADFVARLVAQGISGPLGQPVIVENRGIGVIQGDFLSKAPPDGYGVTVTGANFWIGPLLQKVPYDVVSDFSPVSLISREVGILTVHPSMPVKSVKELIALAKARPKDLNYSSAGTATPSHFALELFKSMAGVSIVHVAYKGGAPALTALLSGEVQVGIVDAGAAAPHVKAGRLRALAVTSAEPSALGPGLATVAAAGVPGYESVSMTGMFAPGKTPGAIIARLSQEIARFVNRPDVKEKFLSARGETVGNSPEEFAAVIKSDIAKMRKVIKNAGIGLD